MSSQYGNFLVFKKHTSHGTEYFQNMIYYLMTSPVPWYMRWRWVHLNLKVSTGVGAVLAFSSREMVHFSLTWNCSLALGIWREESACEGSLSYLQCQKLQPVRGASRLFLLSAFWESCPCHFGKARASFSLHFVHTMVQNTETSLCADLGM